MFFSTLLDYPGFSDYRPPLHPAKFVLMGWLCKVNGLVGNALSDLCLLFVFYSMFWWRGISHLIFRDKGKGELTWAGVTPCFEGAVVLNGYSHVFKLVEVGAQGALANAEFVGNISCCSSIAGTQHKI